MQTILSENVTEIIKHNFVIDCNFFDQILEHKDDYETILNLIKTNRIEFFTIYLVINELKQISNVKNKQEALLKICTQLNVKVEPTQTLTVRMPIGQSIGSGEVFNLQHFKDGYFKNRKSKDGINWVSDLRTDALLFEMAYFLSFRSTAKTIILTINHNDFRDKTSERFTKTNLEIWSWEEFSNYIKKKL